MTTTAPQTAPQTATQAQTERERLRAMDALVEQFGQVEQFGWRERGI